MVFLKARKRFVQGPQVIRIGDHLPAHRSKVRKRFLSEQRDWLPIEWLPGYAPDLHPTEGVWNNIQGREMANFCPDHMDEAVTAFRRGLGRSPEGKTYATASEGACPVGDRALQFQ
jgi:transposase